LKDIKFLAVGDLHLLDREIGATIGYAEESERNLIKINNFYEESENLFVILGGDIQHALPEDMRAMSKWRSRLMELRDQVKSRLLESGLINDIKVYDKDNNLMDIMDEHSCLFSLKGNHDYKKRETRESSFTFFDDLVEANIISVPKKIIIGNTQINLYSSEECMDRLPKDLGIDNVIALYHDPIVQDGRLMDNYMGKMISPDNHKFFTDVDLAILNDIHLQIAPYKVTTVGDDGVGTTTEVVTHGSIGRTSFNDSHKRDNALLTEVLLDSEGYISYELKVMDLLPYKELFDYEKVIKVKKRENMFDQFSLEIEKIDKVKGDPRDDVRDMDIEDNIKEICLELLDEVMGE
jgi:hypothetical protein